MAGTQRAIERQLAVGAVVVAWSLLPYVISTSLVAPSPKSRVQQGLFAKETHFCDLLDRRRVLVRRLSSAAR